MVSPSQARYLVLRVMGLNILNSLKMANRNSQLIYVWRQDETFRQIEDYVTNHRSYFAEDAGDLYSGNLGRLALLSLHQILDKAAETDFWELEARDRRQLQQAVNMSVRILRRSSLDTANEESDIESVLMGGKVATS
jgi:hypothetical protein